jgi:hypothetical protein
MTLLGCGDDGGMTVSPDADHGLPEFTVSNTDASGDTHVFTIRCTDLVSELPVTFTTDGPHVHTLQLSVEELQLVLAGMTVETRFTEGHEHFFAITKPEDACTGF